MEQAQSRNADSQIRRNVIVSIHQPNFLPWLGFFSKMASSDIFILLDRVQYTKNGYQNRVQIRTSQGALWLTIPVLTTGRFGQLTSAVEIDNGVDWRKKVLSTIQMNYARAPYFDLYFPDLRDVILKEEWILLSKFCVSLLTLCASWLNINTRLVLSSAIDCETRALGTELLVQLCGSVGAATYISGQGGRKYMDDRLFSEAKIELCYQQFRHPEYKQLWGEFIPGLSVIDLLFNCGPRSAEIIRQCY